MCGGHSKPGKGDREGQTWDGGVGGGVTGKWDGVTGKWDIISDVNEWNF